ncbi:hypothetical protein HK101_009235 [Irineochytrium annulatum]|nr:hypothetical protein HK101_009235 [Irineochytrium annulatum]
MTAPPALAIVAADQEDCSVVGTGVVEIEVDEVMGTRVGPEEELALKEQENGALREQVDTLGTRVLQLEAQLKDASERQHRDRAHFQEDLQKKNTTIDRMRVKLNRYEFAIKEAVLFLSKPIEGYETWLNNRAIDNAHHGPGGAQALLASAIAGAITAAQGGYPANGNASGATTGSNAPPSPTPPTKAGHHTHAQFTSSSSAAQLSGSSASANTTVAAPQETGRSRAPSTAPKPSGGGWGMASLHPSHSSAALLSGGASTPNGIPSHPPQQQQQQQQHQPIPEKIQGLTNLDIQCLECMRLANNYLKNAQASVAAMLKEPNYGAEGHSSPGLQATHTQAPRLFTDSSRMMLEEPVAEEVSSLAAPMGGGAGRASSASATSLVSLSPAKGARSPLSGGHVVNAGETVFTVSIGTQTSGMSLSDNDGVISPVGSLSQSPSTYGPPAIGGTLSGAGGSGSGSTGAANKAPATSAAARLTAVRQNTAERQASTALTNQVLLNAARALPEEDGDIVGSLSGEIAETSASAPTTSPSRTAAAPAGTHTRVHSTGSVVSGAGGIGASKRCQNCRDLMLQLNHHVDTIQSLRDDVTTLANQLEEERSTRDRIQLSKDILDAELEELTSQLFEQANLLVVAEARKVEGLEFQCRDTREEVARLQKINDSLEAAVSRSRGGNGGTGVGGSPYGSARDLASGERWTASGPVIPRGPGSHAFYAVAGLAPQRGANGSGAIGASLGNLLSLPGSGSPAPVRTGGATAGGSASASWRVLVDGQVLSEFQEHVKQASLAGSMPPAQALLATGSTAFMRRCVSEDVEPCLFYSYGAHLSSGGLFGAGAKSASGLSSGMRKKMMEALGRNGVEVVEVTGASGAEEEAPARRVKCGCCALVRECDFRVRVWTGVSSGSGSSPASSPVGGQMPPLPPLPVSQTGNGTLGPAGQSESFPVCGFCRDRVVAVSDFYSFMGHLRQGLIGPGKQGVTILGMFRHAMWLRRRMACGRVGSCGLFEPESLVAMDRRGEGEWEKVVQIVS